MSRRYITQENWGGLIVMFLRFWWPVLALLAFGYVALKVQQFNEFNRDCVASEGVTLKAPFARYYCVSEQSIIAGHYVFF
jgi:hypothetical protein